jgi:hypothetical protein
VLNPAWTAAYQPLPAPRADLLHEIQESERSGRSRAAGGTQRRAGRPAPAVAVIPFAVCHFAEIVISTTWFAGTYKAAARRLALCRKRRILAPLPPTTPSVGVAANSGRAERDHNLSSPARRQSRLRPHDDHRREMGSTPADPGGLIAAPNAVLAPSETFGISAGVDLGRPLYQSASEMQGNCSPPCWVASSL